MKIKIDEEYVWVKLQQLERKHLSNQAPTDETMESPNSETRNSLETNYSFNYTGEPILLPPPQKQLSMEIERHGKKRYSCEVTLKTEIIGNQEEFLRNMPKTFKDKLVTTTSNQLSGYITTNDDAFCFFETKDQNKYVFHVGNKGTHYAYYRKDLFNSAMDDLSKILEEVIQADRMHKKASEIPKDFTLYLR